MLEGEHLIDVLVESLLADFVQVLGEGNLFGRKSVELVVVNADRYLVGNIRPFRGEI
jgi:hypothetical protein